MSNWLAQIAPLGSLRVQLLGQPAGQLHVVVRVLVGHGRHRAQIGTHQPQHVHLLLALRLGDHDHGPVAAHVADQRQPDPGIAGRALDDRAARAQQPLLLGVGDDRQRRPVLDAAAGVQELALAQDLAARGVGDLVQAHQRRVADQIDEALANVHAAPCDHWPGTPFLERRRRRGKPWGEAMPASDQSDVLAFLAGWRPRCHPRTHRHPRRHRPPDPRPRLQAQAPGPLQLPRLHHPGAARADLAPRARAQPQARARALPARPPRHRRPRRPRPGRRRPTGRMAAGNAPLPGRGGARPRRRDDRPARRPGGPPGRHRRRLPRRGLAPPRQGRPRRHARDRPRQPHRPRRRRPRRLHRRRRRRARRPDPDPAWPATAPLLEPPPRRRPRPPLPRRPPPRQHRAPGRPPGPVRLHRVRRRFRLHRRPLRPGLPAHGPDREGPPPRRRPPAQRLARAHRRPCRPGPAAAVPLPARRHPRQGPGPRRHVAIRPPTVPSRRRYLDLAIGFLAPAPPILLAIGGGSGTGKTTLARCTGARPAAARLRVP